MTINWNEIETKWRNNQKNSLQLHIRIPTLRNTLDMEEHTHWLMFMQGFTE
jgi:hypothetical protein